MTSTCEICSRPAPSPCRITVEDDTGTRLVLEVCAACRDRLLYLVAVGRDAEKE